MQRQENQLSEKNKIKLERMLAKYLKMQDEWSKLNDECVEMKNKLQIIFKKLGIDSYKFEFEIEDEVKLETASFFITTRAEPTFDNERIKKKLGKSLYNRICDKKYEIVDFENFAKLMNEYEVPVSIVKDFLEIKEQIKLSKMQELYDAGKLDMTKIKDCYSIKVKEYLQTRRNK